MSTSAAVAKASAAALALDAYFVRQHIGLFKAAREYDLVDPHGGQIALRSREPRLGAFTKLFRFTDYKRATPFHAQVTDASGAVVLRIDRGVSLFLSKVAVCDGAGVALGGFQQRLWSIGGRFDVHDARGEVVCSLRGNWIGWEFQFEHEGRVLARVSKKWAGVGREFFTQADDYVLQIEPAVPRDAPVRALMIAAVLVIDLVLKS
ncbi:MAG: RNAase [Planctomycetota bacterium]|nr:MAG: RNAase [Planctomycetota bacterium]